MMLRRLLKTAVVLVALSGIVATSALATSTAPVAPSAAPSLSLEILWNAITQLYEFWPLDSNGIPEVDNTTGTPTSPSYVAGFTPNGNYGTPLAAGTINVTVTATDQSGFSASETLEIVAQ